MEDIILKKVDDIAEQMIKSIIEIVKIDSVETAPLENAPFGSGVKAALDATLDLAASLGFVTTNIDNYIGYASYGESKNYICAIGHLDVVPVGTGWKQPPLMGFTPDCKYPVVYGERGRAIIKICGKKDRLKEFFDLVNNYILNAKNNGERFNIDFQDQEFGLLEVRNYQLELDGDPSIQFSVSYPASVTVETIVNNIKMVVSNFEVNLVGNYDPVKFPLKCKLVKTLVHTYEKVTGDDGTPVTTTGGTYAKLMPNIVPFGPSFPGQKGIGHQPNEWMTIEDIITNAKIYALSLYNLAK